MFPTNTNPAWNNTFQTNPIANPFFTQTLTMLINQAVQQAVWQTLLMQQYQNQSQFQGFGGFAFPQWNNAPQAVPFQNTIQHGYPVQTQPQGPFGQPFQPSQGGWVNGSSGPGYFGTVQFQHVSPQSIPHHNPTNEVVEAATKRNGSR